MIESASKALDQDSPPNIDHQKHENPYKSRYGSDWKTQLKKSVTFCHSTSICDYIEHMMEQSRKVMEGTIHEDTWMVYHDALSLMTSKATKEWMSFVEIMIRILNIFKLNRIFSSTAIFLNGRAKETIRN